MQNDSKKTKAPEGLGHRRQPVRPSGQIFLFLLLVTLLAGCASQPARRYVIHDTVEDDYFIGGNTFSGQSAKVFTRPEADRVLQRLQREEACGYADVGPEAERPIKIEPITERP